LNKKKSVNIRTMTITAMLSAIGFILMFFEFSVPFMPPFIKLDISELPALIGAFSLGPVSGAAICLIKNVLHLFTTNSGGVGELSNFLLGLCFVIPAGLLYKRKKSRKNALMGSVIGAVFMGLMSVPLNYFVVYPVYTKFMPIEAILNAYQLILPSTNSLLSALLIFNLPFTLLKGLINVGITFVIYKHISPLIHGNQHR
jgi:riboflavin transporter